MSKKEEVQRYDMLGQEVFVGDYVVFSASGGMLDIGIIHNFSPKGITMVQKRMWRGEIHEDKVNRPTGKVVKCSEESIKLYVIKQRLNQMND